MNNRNKVLLSIAVFLILLFSIYLLLINNPFTETEEITSESNNEIEEINIEIETDMAIYRVREGDTLESIASEYGLDVDTIKWANALSSEGVSPGQILDIPPADGIEITVQEGDTLESIADDYSVSEDVIADFNWLDSPFDLEVGEELFIPGGEKLE